MSSRAQPGQPFAVTAAEWNALQAAARAHAASRLGGLGGGPAAVGAAAPALAVAVKNLTGAAREAFDAAAADAALDPLLTVTGHEYAVSAGPIVGARPRTGGGDRPLLLVFRGPVPADGLGEAVVRGVTLARVDLTSLAHRFADLPATGHVLASADDGPVRILQAATADVGEQLCLVDVLQAVAGDPPAGVVKSAVDNGRCDSLGNLVFRRTPVYGPPTGPPPAGSNTVEGVVTLDGDPAEGREVVLTFGGFEWRGVTDEDGAYQVDDLPGGTYVVLVVPEPGETGTIHDTATVPTTPATVNFALTT